MIEDKITHSRQYIWNYFSLHASQRLSTFNFYIVISTLLLTGTFAIIKEAGNIKLLAIIPAGLLILLSFVFYKLDQRNKFIIKVAERSLAKLERIDFSNTCCSQIFRFEEKATNKFNSDKNNFITKPYTYSNCFNLIFISFSLVGLLGIILTVIIYFRGYLIIVNCTEIVIV